MDTRTKPISVSLSPELARRARVLAAQQNKSRSQLVSELLAAALVEARETEAQREVQNDDRRG